MTPFFHISPPALFVSESPILNNVRLALLLTGCRSQSSAQFLKGDQEPWAFRGGLAGEFQVSDAQKFTAIKMKNNVIGKEDNGTLGKGGALVCQRSAECSVLDVTTSSFSGCACLYSSETLRF